MLNTIFSTTSDEMFLRSMNGRNTICERRSVKSCLEMLVHFVILVSNVVNLQM